MSQLARQAVQALRLPIVESRAHKLQDVLTRLPKNGVGAKVRPMRYSARKYPEGSYFQITQVRLNMEEKQKCKAFGYKFWNGRQVGSKPARIRNGSKEPWEIVDHAPPSSSANSVSKQE